MKRRLLQVAGGMGIFGMSFLTGLWVTFPEDAAITRLRWEVQDASDGAMALDLSGISPWWTGAYATDVRLVQFEARGGGRAPEPTELLSAPWAKVRVGLLSLFRSQPRFIGAVAVGGGEIGFDTVMHQGDRGLWKPAQLHVEAGAFPLSALPPVQGVSLQGQGTFDLDLQLDAPDGLRKSNGTASLVGNGLVIEKLVAPDQPMLSGFDMVVEFSEFDIGFDITEGRAKVSRGRILSNLFEVDLSGEILLMEDISRSRLRLRAVVKLGDSLKMFEGFLKDARQSDGSFAWRINGTVIAPTAQPEGSGNRSRPVVNTPPRVDRQVDAGGGATETPARTVDEDPPKAGGVEADVAARRAEERRRRREEARRKLDLPPNGNLAPDLGRIRPRVMPTPIDDELDVSIDPDEELEAPGEFLEEDE